jgi:hypothetical protein
MDDQTQIPDAPALAVLRAYGPELIPGAPAAIVALKGGGWRHLDEPALHRAVAEYIDSDGGRRWRDPSVKLDPEPPARTVIKRLVRANVVKADQAEALEQEVGRDVAYSGSAARVAEVIARKLQHRSFDKFRTTPNPVPESLRRLYDVATTHFADELKPGAAEALAESLYRQGAGHGSERETVRAIARVLQGVGGGAVLKAGRPLDRDDARARPDDARSSYGGVARSDDGRFAPAPPRKSLVR